MTDPHKNTAADTLASLQGWADAGWLRRLDSALAAFLWELDPTAAPALLVSAAFLTHLEGRGHTCLALTEMVTHAETVLGLPPAAQQPLRALLATLPGTVPGWLQALHASPLVRVVSDATGALADTIAPDRGQPLVLHDRVAAPRLYLRRYWLHERWVASAVMLRATSQLQCDEVQARYWLVRIFASPETLPDWQKIACAIALRATLTVITGGPGTGKTYTAARLLALLFAMDQQPGQLRIALAAPTGKAAARLRQSIDAALQALSASLGHALDLARLTQGIGAAHTLHALLGASTDTRQFRYHAGNPLDVDVLIVDEASMVHLEMLSALLQALPAGAKLVLLGDKDQLASVEAGAVLGDLCRNASAGAYNPETRRYLQSVAGLRLPPVGLVPEGAGSPVSQQTVMLRESRRFGGMLGQLARAVNAGDSDTAQTLLTRARSGELYAMQSPGVQAVWELAVRGRPGAKACYADYLQCIAERPLSATTSAEQHGQWVRQVLQAFDSFRVLCAVRDGEWGTLGLNRSIQTALTTAGWLKPKGEWFIGRPVMVTRNDASLGVFNGDVGIALPGPPGSVAPKVYFLDGDRLHSVGVGRLAHVETAFALTVHKSQGSEFLHVALVLPPGGAKVLSRALVYTGLTRARECLTLFEAQPGLLQTAIAMQSERASGLF